MEWLVKGLIPATGLAVVYGPSAVGKSFLMIDMACRVAEGKPWAGRRTQKAPVIYLCLEGIAGFSNRIRAWELQNQATMPSNLHVIAQAFNLMEEVDAQQLLAAYREISKGRAYAGARPVFVIDTLSRALHGAEENDSSSMGTALAACHLLTAQTGGLVVLVHHSGKDADRGPRGHSSLVPAADASLLVGRKGDQRFWESKKVKDGPDGIREEFCLERYSLGADCDGDEVSSCAFKAVGEGAPTPLPSENIPGSLQKALQSLRACLPEADTSTGVLKTTLEQFRADCMVRSGVTSGSGQRNAFARARKALLERNWVLEQGQDLVLTDVGRSALNQYA